MKIWNSKAYILRRLFHPGIRGWKAFGFQRLDVPSVYLVHHQNLFGPVHTLAVLPEEAHLWALAAFCDRKSCRRQYQDYTLTVRFGWPKILARPISFFLSWFVPGVMEAFGAIPVYRGSREIRKTMELSEKALRRGESLLICPDKDYTDRSPEVGSIYQGFLHLEKAYFRECQEHLAFVPVFCDQKKKQVIFGEAVQFSGKTSFVKERSQVVERLRDQWRRMGNNGEKEREASNSPESFG